MSASAHSHVGQGYATHSIPQQHLHQRAGLSPNQAGDPTRTKTLRDKYARQMRKRYRELARGIQSVIIEMDYFDLEGGPRGNAVAPWRDPDVGTRPSTLPAPDVPLPQRPNPHLPRTDRMEDFNDWLRNASHAVVLGGDGTRWTDEYVRYAYGRGAMQGNQQLGMAGYNPEELDLLDTFRGPIHQDTLSIFYRRQFDLLRGVNDAMASQISQELTQGMLAGQGPRDVAKSLNSHVQGIGIKRANVIARTEIPHAYNEGALNRYEEILGSTGQLAAVVEFLTAGDNRVCSQCQSLEGAIYTVEDARGVLPIHPQCRCTWVPLSRAQARAT